MILSEAKIAQRFVFVSVIRLLTLGESSDIIFFAEDTVSLRIKMAGLRTLRKLSIGPARCIAREPRFLREEPAPPVPVVREIRELPPG